MCDNIQNCCRICLDDERDRVSIIKDSSILLHLKSCLAITIPENDILPKVICVVCVSKLCEFYNFQLNARCSQDWLDTVIREKAKKQNEQKVPIQPLPDSEYNSDSLLEFLNNTENIEEYLNNLGKEDIPSIVKMFDKNNENPMDLQNRIPNNTKIKQPSPKKKESKPNYEMNMEIDVLDSDLEIVQELLLKENNVSKKQTYIEKKNMVCFACKINFDSAHKLLQHYSICDRALRTCIKCDLLFDSKNKLLQHKVTCHTTVACACNCGKQFNNKDNLVKHYQDCITDFAVTVGCAFRCKQCGDMFKDRLHLYKHAQEHVMKAQMKVCYDCGNNFVGEIALAIHRKNEHPTPDNMMFRCKVCHLSSKDRRELYNHIQDKHSTALEPQRHLCELCGKSFTTRATLFRHATVHRKKSKVTFIVPKKLNSVAKQNTGSNIINENKKEVMFKKLEIDTVDDMAMCELCGLMIRSEIIDIHMKGHS